MGNYLSAHFVLTYQMASLSLKELQWHWREHLATLNVLFCRELGVGGVALMSRLSVELLWLHSYFYQILHSDTSLGWFPNCFYLFWSVAGQRLTLWNEFVDTQFSHGICQHWLNTAWANICKLYWNQRIIESCISAGFCPITTNSQNPVPEVLRKEMLALHFQVYYKIGCFFLD